MARSFNGSSEYANATLTDAFGGSFPYSVACWARSASETAEQYACGPCSPAGTSMCLVGFRGDIAGDPILGYNVNGGNSGFPRSDGVVDYAVNTWYHSLVVVESSTLRRIYIDGVDVDSDTNTVGTIGATHMYEGCYIAGGARSAYFNGHVMHVAGWHAALTPGDAIALAKGFSPRKVAPFALRFYDPGFAQLLQLAGNGASAVSDSSGGFVAHHRSIGI